MVENRHPETLELGVVDNPANVDRLAGVADSGTDGQCDLL